MNRPPMQEEDDGFGDFRAKVKGLPREQRMAELKKMEDAVLENLRSNMLADLYADDQPSPAPRQPPVYDMEENDARTKFEDENGYGDFEKGMVDAGNGDPRGDNSHINDAYWKQPGMEQKFQSSRKPAPQGRQAPSYNTDPYEQDRDQQFGQPQGGGVYDMEENDARTKFEDENGYGDFEDGMVDAGNGDPRGDNSHINDAYWKQPGMEQKFQSSRKPAQPQGAQPMPKAPMGAIIDDEQPLVFDDVASPTKFQQPPSGAEDGDEGMVQERLAESEGKIKRYMGNFQVGDVPDSEPPETDGYVLNPKWVEWSMKDATPQELDAALQQAENDMRQAAYDGYEGGDGYYGILTNVAVLRKMKQAMSRPKPPAPKAQGMFGRPPSVSRPMLEQ